MNSRKLEGPSSLPYEFLRDEKNRAAFPVWWEKAAVFVAGIWSDILGGEPPSRSYIDFAGEAVEVFRNHNLLCLRR